MYSQNFLVLIESSNGFMDNNSNRPFVGDFDDSFYLDQHRLMILLFILYISFNLSYVTTLGVFIFGCLVFLKLALLYIAKKYFGFKDIQLPTNGWELFKVFETSALTFLSKFTLGHSQFLV